MKTRLFLAAIGTLWAALVLSGYFWVGIAFMNPLSENAAGPYWSLGWILWGFVGALPFIIFSITLEHPYRYEDD